MFPTPLSIGPLNFNFYGFMVALGALAALGLMAFTAPRRDIPVARVRDFSFWMILAGLLGSRIFYVIFHWPEFSAQPALVFAYWRGGLMFQGGLVTALALSPFFFRRYGLKPWPTTDVVAAPLALGQSFGRVGCFGAGCCYGGVVSEDNPIALIFPHGSLAPADIPLWPTQLLEAAGLSLLTVVLLLALKSDRPYFQRPGRVAALYLFGAGLLRLIMEMLRGDYRGDPVIWGLPPTTLTAIGAAALGLFLMTWKTRSRPAGTAQSQI